MNFTRKAFTSIELMVVLGVVGILTASAVPGVLSSLRRGAMASAVNQIVGLTEEARTLAVSTSPPAAADPTWQPEDRFGVLLRPRADGRYVVALTRGPQATASAIWVDPRRAQAREVVLPAGVMVMVAEKVGDDLQPLTGELGWTLAYRTGSTVIHDGTDFITGASLGADGSPVAGQVALRSRDGGLAAGFAVYPIGLAYGGEVVAR